VLISGAPENSSTTLKNFGAAYASQPIAHPLYDILWC
jgi:hypothetical protein